MPLKWFCLTSLKSNTSFLAVPYPPGGWASMESRSTVNIHILSTAPYKFPTYGINEENYFVKSRHLFGKVPLK